MGKGFDFTGVWQIEKAIREWPKTHTVYTQPEPTPEEEPVYTFELGFAEYAAEHPEVGEPDGSLVYDEVGARQSTTTGLLIWDRGVNDIIFIPDIAPPEQPPAFVRAMDVSSHQPTDLTELIAANGVQHVIVKLYHSAEQPSPDISRAQIASALANGCTVGGYVWPYKGLDARLAVREAIAVARSAGLKLPILWIDYEPYETSQNKPTWEEMAAAVDECYLFGVQPGIYSGAWCWDLGDVFVALPLWAAQYDNDDIEDFTQFGGWQVCGGKQYTSDPVDLSVFRPEYTIPAAPEPPTEPVDWQAMYEVEKERADALYAEWKAAGDKLDAIQAVLNG